MFLAFLSSDDWQAVSISIKVSLCSASICLPAAIALGWFLARTQWRGRWLVETLISLPLVLPPVVTGFVLLVLFSPTGWIGYPLHTWFGWDIVLTWQAAVLASMVVSFPLAVRPIQLAFQASDRQLETTARTLGAGPWATFFHITLPLAKRGIAAGWLLSFARSLGEFGATIMVAGNILGETRTIPLGVFSYVNSPDGIYEAWPLVLVSVMLSCVALCLGQWIERRYDGRAV
ncbi:MAG: molybdate ABC transporter permease subunit [Pirellulaceae bacterium]|nr:molybdate ABC transporter permease subunit [Pirellulaceae bacterium]